MMKINKIFAIVALATGSILGGCEKRNQPPIEDDKDKVTRFVEKHAVTLPPEIEKVPAGVYTDVEVQTPNGIEICNVSISEDKSFARTRQIVLSDCHCSP